jgi:hypothetical protein
MGWTRWLDSCRQPMVLVFAASWGDADEATLDAIRGELRGLGAALVVATPQRSFCFYPDDAIEAPVPPELCTLGALTSLYRRYGIRALEIASGVLVLTLLDEEGHVRIQSTRDAPAGFESAVLETLRWATSSAAFGTRVLYSRSEAVMLSLMGAVALPAAEACTPKSVPPTSAAPPEESAPSASTPFSDRSSAA